MREKSVCLWPLNEVITIAYLCQNATTAHSAVEAETLHAPMAGVVFLCVCVRVPCPAPLYPSAEASATADADDDPAVSASSIRLKQR